jgi:hypothetical protein
MIFLVAVIVGVLVGLLLGGKLSNLPSLRLRWLWLVLLGLLLQVLIFPLFSEHPILPFATVPLHYLSYSLVLLFLVANLRVLPLLALGAGALLNLCAIAANGGRMPASATALAAAGYVDVAEKLTSGGTHGNVLLMSETTRLNGLGDWLYLPSWVPFSTAFSVGDVLILIGIAWLIMRGMRGHG